MLSLKLTIQYILSSLFHEQAAAETLATSKYQLLASSPTHTLSNSCTLCNENGAGLKARNCVQFCFKGMMCKEQCMTTVETTNNGTGARNFIDHNCACTYFIVGIMYLKHDKCTLVHYVLHEQKLLPPDRLLRFSWWWKHSWVSFLFLLLKRLRFSSPKGKRHTLTSTHTQGYQNE